MSSEEWKKKNKDKMREYRRKWYIKNKEYAKKRVAERKAKLAEWFREYKKELACVQCGENHIAVLAFHHEDPNRKEWNVSQMTNNGLSIDRIKEEIEKCTVLCMNCHGKLHYEERNKGQ